MKSKRFVLNALLVVAILTLFVFSDSYMNHPRFGYALYAVFSGPRIKRTPLICPELQPESTKPNSFSDFGQTRNQSLRNNDNSANSDSVDYRPDRNKRFEV